MVHLISLREFIKNFYVKKEHIVFPIWKFFVSFLMLVMVQRLFPYYEVGHGFLILIGVSAVQAALPLSFLFFSGSALIAWSLWHISIDVFAVFLILFLICLLLIVRMEPKYCYLVIVTAVCFYLHLEYLIPVMVAIAIGTSGIAPVGAGILLYFFSRYVNEIYLLVSSNTEVDTGLGMQHIAQLLFRDVTLFVMLACFILVIIITTAIYNIVHEKSWLLAILFGHVILALLLLAGRLVADLDYSIVRVFVVAILGIFASTVVQFFCEIGDISRIERTSFEDEEYIYYVKAVPKIKISQAEKNITAIEADDLVESEDVKEMVLTKTKMAKEE